MELSASIKKPLFIIGAAHSQKSELAHSCLEKNLTATVVGTCVSNEPELANRVEMLKSKRPAVWKSIDVTTNIASHIKEALENSDQVLIDSVSQYIAQFLIEQKKSYSDDQIVAILNTQLTELIEIIENSPKIVVVSSEVGGGLSPKSDTERLFRQITSRVNVKIAAVCKSVVMVTAGIPLIIK